MAVLMETVGILLPGAHVILLSEGPRWVGDFLACRQVGLEPRDTMAILGPKGCRIAGLFRQPLAESTLVAQILATGTGALNIDATRVRHSNAVDFEKHKQQVETLKAKGGSMGNSWKNSSDLSGASEVSHAGRWPANLVFIHTEGCRLTGTQTVAAPVINRFTDGMKPFGEGAGHQYETVQTGDADGNEEIPVWSCQEGCPVVELDGQSGILKNGGQNKTSTRNLGIFDPALAWKGELGSSNFSGDSGGASRFFRQFQTEGDLYKYLETLIRPPGGQIYRSLP